MSNKRLIKDKLITKRQIEAARNECMIHSQLAHENVIKLYEYSEDDNEISLIMEYANQAMYLSDLIIDGHTPVENEQDLQIYAYDILNGLAYIHKNGIIHGDVKFENMLAHKEDDDSHPIIKICDFGLAQAVDPANSNKILKSQVAGTWGYIAPEFKNSEYIGREVDIWAYGLLLYEMAVAYKPTQLKNYQYRDGELPFHKSHWRGKPEELKSLIRGCMELDPNKRLTAEEALQHPYFITQV